MHLYARCLRINPRRVRFKEASPIFLVPQENFTMPIAFALRQALRHTLEMPLETPIHMETKRQYVVFDYPIYVLVTRSKCLKQ